MKKILFGLSISAALICGETKIPEGAVKVEPYTYRYTDAKGNKWIYRETPFGVVKKEDTPEQQVKDNSTPVKVTQTGDSVKFEKKTPFGIHTWTKKLSELTADDKALLEKSQAAEKR
jgi:hypothetical protein